MFALVLGAPTLKLRGDYLAIVTISAAEIIRYVGRSALLTDFTGAAQGLQGKSYRDPFTNLSFFGGGSSRSASSTTPTSPTAPRGCGCCCGSWPTGLVVAAVLLAQGRWKVGRAVRRGADRRVGRCSSAVLLFFLFPLNYQNTGVNGWWVRFVAWLLVAICLVVVSLLVRSPWGRLLRGIREDEDAIRSLGKNVFAIKMQALIIGGLFGALGGMIYVLPSSVQPDSMGRSLTFFCYTALLIGGAATIFGPVLGAIIFYSARIMIKGIANAYVPDSIMNGQQTEQFSYIVVGVALMLIVIFRPQGILGDKRELRFNV